MMVKFATTCDVVRPGGIGTDKLRCGARSEEYTEWPTCRGCGNNTCPEHYDAPTYRLDEWDDEGEDGRGAMAAETVYCVDCADAYGPEDADQP